MKEVKKKRKFTMNKGINKLTICVLKKNKLAIIAIPGPLLWPTQAQSKPNRVKLVGKKIILNPPPFLFSCHLRKALLSGACALPLIHQENLHTHTHTHTSSFRIFLEALSAISQSSQVLISNFRYLVVRFHVRDDFRLEYVCSVFVSRLTRT